MINQLPIPPIKPLSVSQDSDLELVERLRSGDTTALDELLRLYWPSLVRYAERLLGNPDAAEDVAQQVFLQLWQRRADWQVGGSVRTYLYRLAHHRAIDEQRRQAVRQRWDKIFHRQERSRPVTPEQVAQGNELDAAVHAAIASLPERRREVFELVRFHDLSYQEVGEIMGISAQTVANQMSAALRALRLGLEPFLDEPASYRLRVLCRSTTPAAAVLSR
jgi:RNA polymerase sigma-70 factor, ECF subfamily